MDRQKIERCLEQVAAYRACGQKASEWAAANGVKLAMLAKLVHPCAALASAA